MVKILVIRLSSLGDVVLTAPVFRALREAYPEARLTALVKEEFADVLAANPDVHNRLILHKGESLGALVKRVRAEHFDIVIDLHSNLRSLTISALSGAKKRIRYRKAALARRLYVGLRVPSPELERHTLDRYMGALRRLDPGEPFFEPGRLVSVPTMPTRLLVIQTAFLGDAVLTTPLLGALRERFPKAEISVLCTPEVAEVFSRHPSVSEVILFDKRAKQKSLRSRWSLVKTLRRKHFDLAVIPHRSLTSALLGAMAGIPRRIGFSSSQGRWLLTDAVPFRWGVHDVDRNLSLLTPLGVQEPTGHLWLRPEASVSEGIAGRLAKEGVNRGDFLLGINAGSVWATKRWLPERFAEVADRAMKELGAKVLFLGGPKDKPVMEQVLSHMKGKPLNWVGETNLRELIAAVFRCSAFLTNDSGPMHIAVAAQVPTVAIFGPTTRELGFFPYGTGHTVIEKDLECRPCGLHGAKACPLGHFECMKSITSDEVFESIRAIREKPPVERRVGAL